MLFHVLYMLQIQCISQVCEMVTTINLNLYVIKLRHRQVKQLVEAHAARKWG